MRFTLSDWVIYAILDNVCICLDTYLGECIIVWANLANNAHRYVCMYARLEDRLPGIPRPGCLLCINYE